MIKLLRNIRRKLIVRGKNSEYFKYAIGEIFLVVIGILIALQINTLNEIRKENNKEQKVLIQLKEEFLSDLNQLNSKMEVRKQMLVDFEDCLEYFATQNCPSDSIFETKLTSLILPLTFDPIQNEIVSSGRIKIIKNDSLKRYLTNWTKDVQQLIETEELFVTHYMNSTIPFFEKTGYSRHLIKKLWVDNIKTTVLKGENKHDINKIRASTLSTNTKSLLEFSELESIISNAYSLNLINMYESEDLKKSIMTILNLIESELKNN